MKRVGRYTILLETAPKIAGYASVVGKKEKEGPLGSEFDRSYKDTSLGESSWEKAESRLQKEAVEIALQKAGIHSNDVDTIFAGDLLNQCISSTFGLRSLNIPFLGQYGACSTMAQTLAMAALFVESGAARIAAAVTSSHFCSAERQFRLPLEYGGQRPPTAQWTATASGAAIVVPQSIVIEENSVKMKNSKENNSSEKIPVIKEVCIGKITDMGIKDANNMGAAMAPAAAQTILDFLSDTNTKPADYDLIVTGDLGHVGSELLLQLMEQEGVDISSVHNDCGKMLFDRKKQDVHAGGSGCGCSASVLCSKLLNDIKAGYLNNILFVATGALMSTTSSQQGESIPSIAHLIHLKGI